MVDALTTRDALRSLLLYLDSRVRREQLETWFRSLDVLRIEDSEIELSVTSQFVRDWLLKNYMTLLQDAVRSLGEEKRRIVLTQRQEDGWDSLGFFQPTPLSEEIDEFFRTSAPVATAAATPHAPNSHPMPSHPSPSHLGHTPVRRRPGTLLNPNYTFDRFVVGSCNRLAHASALAIGENPGHAYNPLFVHGNVGLGKSHLLQAICHTVLKRSPNARVLYMSCEDFANAFIHALQTKTADGFRDYYRQADVLVIDDVQFLAHKEKCQEEFFHTFNALYDSQRQIVLSSDRRPADIPTIEGRIESRFQWGLVAEVEAPCFETRAAIVRRKAKGRGVELPEEVALLLAERVTSNIRELEGAVIKVIGIAAVTDEPVTLALAESCVRGMPERHAQVTADDVMMLITTEFAINSRELVGKSRTQTVSVPRQIAMFLLREHTELSLDDVGRLYGNRDHTTVLYAVTRVKERILKDRMFKELMDGLSNRLLTRSVRS
ncbi:MAG TPA: chromosomal replication initiator protein DnaA [Planctomycetota bacterium]|nr:chromosomal replication initiator protein DnaA [Planctomycetota bacterium]